jgi:hypothetical protein
MNASFDTRNFDHIYNSWWPWDQIKENSMYYQNRYFNQLISRVDTSIALLNALKANNTNPILINDWQATTINQTRIEMKREGGLDWVIGGAWYLTFAPLAYWSGGIAAVFWIVALAVIVLLVINALMKGVFD